MVAMPAFVGCARRMTVDRGDPLAALDALIDPIGAGGAELDIMDRLRSLYPMGAGMRAIRNHSDTFRRRMLHNVRSGAA